MKKTLLFATPILLLGACSQGGGGGGPDQLAKGRWEMLVSFDSIEAPGMPEAQKTQMQQMMNQQMKAKSAAQCLDGSGDQLQKMREALTAGASGGGTGMNCEYGSDDRFSGGVMKIQATCRRAGAPVQVRLNLDGTFGADTLDSAMEMNIEGQQPGAQQRQMRMVGKMTGRRIGDC